MPAKRIPAEQVAWVPPETKTAVLGDAVAQPDDPYVGEYRIVELGDDDQHDFGHLVQWIDDAPDDPTDGAGHFELYRGDKADYRPQVTG